MPDVRTGDGWAAATLDDLVHERQEELYLVLEGDIEFAFGDGDDSVTLGRGGLVRVDAPTVRRLRNVSEDREAVYFCVGGEGGYVGRDGLRPDGDVN